MNKATAINNFWNSFDIPAYEENTVPDNATYPYITYSKAFDVIGNSIPLDASLWYRSSSWSAVHRKYEEIAERINKNGYVNIPIDNGRMLIYAGSPFGQPLPDDDDMIKRISVNILVEFLTNY